MTSGTAHSTASYAAQPCPPAFREHVFERELTSPHPREAVWSWLNTPETFTKGQIPPFRVEFLHPEGGRPGLFEPGVYNIHHGPLLHLPSVIGEMDAPRYRELRYLYGAYAVSFRLIRPARLDFHLEEFGDATRVKLRVTSHVRKGWGWLWNLGQNIFWPGFAFALRRGPKSTP